MRSSARGGAYSVKYQRPSIITSVQLWLPRSSLHEGVPANRAGIPTARSASTSRIASPVHEAMCWRIDSAGFWFVFSRSVLYSTPTSAHMLRFTESTAARMSRHPATRGVNRARKSARQLLRISSTAA